jgi:23S rRNA pseudouridine955/2504/2580 synthase
MEILKPELTSRLDRFLMKTFPSATLSEIYKWIRTGKIKVNKKKKSHDYKLEKKDEINLFLKSEEIEKYQKRKIIHKFSFTVLYEDQDILIVNKPPFLASQSGIGVTENNLINQVKHYLKDPKATIALANRLDRGTSGIIVLGKHRKINHELYNIYKHRNVEKHYLTLVLGKPKKKEILKDYLKAIRKDFKSLSEITSKKDPKARNAECSYTIKETYKDYSLLEVKLHTGRMHQIRVQLSSRGYPVIGDKLYGDEEQNKKLSKTLKRQFLHAAYIKFKHPFTNKILEINAPLAPDLKRTLEKIKLQ